MQGAKIEPYTFFENGIMASTTKHSLKENVS
jgi:hypothetical protein